MEHNVDAKSKNAKYTSNGTEHTLHTSSTHAYNLPFVEYGSFIILGQVRVVEYFG